MVGCELIGTEKQLNLCFLWKQKYCSFDPRYPTEREYKMRVLGKTFSFMALLTFDIFTKYLIPIMTFTILLTIFYSLGDVEMWRYI